MGLLTKEIWARIGVLSALGAAGGFAFFNIYGGSLVEGGDRWRSCGVGNVRRRRGMDC